MIVLGIIAVLVALFYAFVAVVLTGDWLWLFRGGKK
jgi:hypothetical protein